MSRIWVDFNPSPSALYARLRLDTPRSTEDLHRLPSLHEGMSLKIYDDENEADAVLRLREGVWVAENLTNHRTVWRTTVTDVVGVFRDALIALLPSLERARIPWRDGAASDDFDRLAQAAYDTYVLSAFRFGLTTDEEAVHVPPWGLHVTTYAESDWIEVVSNDVAERPLALVGFKTRDTPVRHGHGAARDGRWGVPGGSGAGLLRIRPLPVSVAPGPLHVDARRAPECPHLNPLG